MNPGATNAGATGREPPPSREPLTRVADALERLGKAPRWSRFTGLLGLLLTVLALSVSWMSYSLGREVQRSSVVGTAHSLMRESPSWPVSASRKGWMERRFDEIPAEAVNQFNTTATVALFVAWDLHTLGEEDLAAWMIEPFRFWFDLSRVEDGKWGTNVYRRFRQMVLSKNRPDAESPFLEWLESTLAGKRPSPPS